LFSESTAVFTARTANAMDNRMPRSVRRGRQIA
jgi:hypothetical protein